MEIYDSTYYKSPLKAKQYHNKFKKQETNKTSHLNALQSSFHMLRIKRNCKSHQRGKNNVIKCKSQFS